MVKRRRIEAPSAEELSRYEDEFSREAAPSKAPPIAQVSAAAVRAPQPGSTEVRAEQARDRSDAERYRSADEKGLLIAEIPLEDVAADFLVRDRMVLDKAELEELKTSIAASGLRLPIEVYALRDGDTPFGLLSGYRRLLAVRELLALTRQEKYRTIRALIRDPQGTGQAIVSMVEENEVRAALSHFERGRVAVIAAKQGAFLNTEAAVTALFSQASKAKRSKVRSFALIFEDLGDMLGFPEALTEKQGLRLAAALREGAEPRLREVLTSGAGGTADEEWALLEAALDALQVQKKPARGGRPPRALPAPGWQDAQTLRLDNGMILRRSRDDRGHVLRIEGQHVDDEMMDLIVTELRAMLDRR